MMKVDTKHKDFNKWQPRWEKVRDAIEGQERIKEQNEIYLPKLNGQDLRAYKGYLTRAQFVNYTSKTLEAALGQLFRKPPMAEGVDEEFTDNIDLQGTSFYYFSRDLAYEMMSVNRVGVLLDYNEKVGRPYLSVFKAESIINWRTEIIDGVNKLSLVVIQGEQEVVSPEDKYTSEIKKVWKVLFLGEGVYRVEDYEKDSLGNFIMVGDTTTPLLAGKPLDVIPFFMITSNGISNDISKAVLNDFVNVNLGHYVNNADYENMLHWTGAKTIVTKGFQGESVPIGGSFDVPVDGDAFYLEATSDSGLKDEMQHKEEQMAVMGSSIITGKGRYVASAETARLTSESEFATLADVSNALSDSLTIIMTLFNMWAGTEDDVTVKYNTDYEMSPIDPQELQAWVGAYQSGGISWDTFFYNMNNREVYPQGTNADEEKQKIEDEEPEPEPIPVFPTEPQLGPEVIEE